MKKKKIVIIVSIILIIIFTIIYFSINFVGKRNINFKDSIKNKQFYLFFTSNLSYGISNGKTLGYRGSDIIFSKKHLGMDNGTLLYSKDKLYFSDKKNIYTYDMKKNVYIKKKRKQEVLDINTLEINNKIVRIYNSGYDNNQVYHTNLYSNKSNLDIKDVILNAGDNGEDIFLLSDRNNNNIFTIYKVSFNKERLYLKEKINFEGIKKGQSTIIGNLLFNNNYLYFIEDDGINSCYLVKINLVNNKVYRKKMFGYKDSDEISSKTPYVGSNSTFIYKGKFYFLDKSGKLFIDDITSDKTNIWEQTLFSNTSSRFVDFNDENIYIFSELDKLDSLSIYNIDKDGKFILKHVQMIKLPWGVSEMYLSNFKVKK